MSRWICVWYVLVFMRVCARSSLWQKSGSWIYEWDPPKQCSATTASGLKHLFLSVWTRRRRSWSNSFASDLYQVIDWSCLIQQRTPRCTKSTLNSRSFGPNGVIQVCEMRTLNPNWYGKYKFHSAIIYLRCVNYWLQGDKLYGHSYNADGFFLEWSAGAPLIFALTAFDSLMTYSSWLACLLTHLIWST